VVLPVHDEAANLTELHARLTAVLPARGTYELIFVEDGSTDDSWGGIQELARTDPTVRGLHLRRNYGHHAALTVGMDAARGEAVIIMDADLQDRPEEIPRLHETLQTGWDAVYGVRVRKRHSWPKRAASALFMGWLRRVTGLGPVLNSNIYRIMTRDFVRASLALRTRDLFLPGIFAAVGGQQTGLPVEHGERFAGTPSYDPSRMLRLAATATRGYAGFPWSGLGRFVCSRGPAFPVEVRPRDLVDVRTAEADHGAP